MSKAIKRIGIMTSGGDCAGLNAAIRGVTMRAILGYGWEVYGIRDGTQGLIDRPIRAQRLTLDDVGVAMMRQGGTMLGTINKGDPFADPMPDGTTRDRTPDIIEALKTLEIDAVVGIGGDGGLSILSRIMRAGGVHFVGIPKTMDNDVPLTELSIGYHSSLAVATEALDRLQPTAASHARVMILEVMGRDAGHNALEAGIAGGADIILIPEIPWNEAAVMKKMAAIKASGRTFALVVVSEAVRTQNGERVKKSFGDGQTRYGGIGDYFGQLLAEKTGAETRVTVLGHVQRGVMPNHTDRLLAQAFGVAAADLLAKGQFDHMVAWQNREIVAIPLLEATQKSQTVDLSGTMVRTARALGICLGDS